jgi:SAM-dependent methyltransferase
MPTTVGRSESTSVAPSTPQEIGHQARYHRELFAALYQWDQVWELAVELAGDAANAARLGLDQLGHFGPPGVELIADRLLEFTTGSMERVLELGSGFGGVIRQLGRVLASRGAQPSLIGIDFVPEHCAVAQAIARLSGDPEPTILVADVRALPFDAMSLDAVFACGSASHFSRMPEVLAEAHRVLRPGGVLAMTEEVSLRPSGGAAVGEEFARHHPAEVFPSASPEQRRDELRRSGLTIEMFDSLTEWAVPLLRQRIRALRLLEECAMRMFGRESYESLTVTLNATADEYERGSVQPTLIVARRPGVGGPSGEPGLSALQ